ncbi:hypothetical protein [Pedobacter sp. L105]|uniref:helix-turn-helix transcriptional regulator n=1 Tax=Pedobacter sp. L105 TaxID=1641871 RepID=UPI00131DB00E|nr:hypothetical protein [Pedobacter sp. L105]
MDTDYTDLLSNHKFIFIVALLFVIIITVMTDYGITLFKKFRHDQITVSQMIVAAEVVVVDVITAIPDQVIASGYGLLQEQNAEKLHAIIQLALKNDDAFFLKFNEFDSDFRKSLLKIAPDLVSTELEFCALLKLNFDTKEIARFTAISVRAVEGKKYRIRKKLNIGSKEDINIFMVNV